MSRRFACPCGQQFLVTLGAQPRKVRCPACAKPLVVPAAPPRTAGGPPAQAAGGPPAVRGTKRFAILGGATLVTAAAVAAVVTILVLNGRTPEPKPDSEYAEVKKPAEGTDKPKPEKKPDPQPSEKPEDPPKPIEKPEPEKPRPTPPEGPKPTLAPVDPDLAPRVLRGVNEARQSAGLPPLALDDDLSRACQELADSVARGDRPDAKTKLVIPAAPAEAVVETLAGAFSRVRLLGPDVGRLGVGHRDSDGKWVTVLDTAAAKPQAAASAVLYPAPEEADVPPWFAGNEVPDPIPESRDKKAGFPVTVTFPDRSRVRDARGRLTDAAGKDVPAWFSSPETPANPRYTRHQGTTLCLITKEPLSPAATYTMDASAEVNGKRWGKRWSFTTAKLGADTDGLIARGVARINAARKAAGLGRLVLDEKLSKGCRAHAVYLVHNGDREGLDFNDEDPKLPGFTPEGRRVAKAAHVSTAPFDPEAMVEGWLASFHYRLPLLDREARTIGLGAARTNREWHAVLVLGDPGPASKEVLVYPAEGQQDLPPFYESGEKPDPIPESKDRQAGFPVMALFPEKARVRDVKAWLKRENKEELSFWLSTPEKPVAPDFQHNTVCLIPKKPLASLTSYTVRVSALVDGKDWEKTWTFRTRDEAREQDEAARQALARVNRVRRLAGVPPVALDEELSKGCRLHARYLATNREHPSTKGLGLHEEDRDLPGYTAEGKRAGGNGVIAQGMPPVASVDDWVATFYHRVPILDPELGRIGFGHVSGSPFGWYVVLDVTTGRGREPMFTYPVGSAVPPRGGDGGYPVTLTFPAGRSVAKVTATLRDADGREVTAKVLTPDDAADAKRTNTVAILPKEALKAGTRYAVEVKAEVNRRPLTQAWSFTTPRRAEAAPAPRGPAAAV